MNVVDYTSNTLLKICCYAQVSRPVRSQQHLTVGLKMSVVVIFCLHMKLQLRILSVIYLVSCVTWMWNMDNFKQMHLETVEVWFLQRMLRILDFAGSITLELHFQTIW